MASTRLGRYPLAPQFAWAVIPLGLLALGCGDELSPASMGSQFDAGCFGNSPDSGLAEIAIGNGDVAAAMWNPYETWASSNEGGGSASAADASTTSDPATGVAANANRKP